MGGKKKSITSDIKESYLLHLTSYIIKTGAGKKVFRFNCLTSDFSHLISRSLTSDILLLTSYSAGLS